MKALTKWVRHGGESVQTRLQTVDWDSRRTIWSHGMHKDTSMQALLQAGATYYIVVSGYQADAGAYQINITTADGSLVPSLPVKGRYAVAQASSIPTSGVINGTVIGIRQHTCFSAECTDLLPVMGSCGMCTLADWQHIGQASHMIGKQQVLTGFAGNQLTTALVQEALYRKPFFKVAVL